MSIILCNCYFLLLVWQPSSLLAKRKASLSEARYGGGNVEYLVLKLYPVAKCELTPTGISSGMALNHKEMGLGRGWSAGTDTILNGMVLNII